MANDDERAYYLSVLGNTAEMQAMSTQDLARMFYVTGAAGSQKIATDQVAVFSSGITFLAGSSSAQMASASSGNSVNMVGSRTFRSGTAPIGSLPGANARSAGSLIHVSDMNGYLMTDGSKWVDILPDTGPRQLKAGALNGWAAGDILLQRTGNMVEFGLGAIDPALQSSLQIITLPAGFRPIGSRVYTLMLRPASGTTPIYVQVQGAGGIVLAQAFASIGHIGSIVFPTTDPWPTTLPGVPA